MTGSQFAAARETIGWIRKQLVIYWDLHREQVVQMKKGTRLIPPDMAHRLGKLAEAHRAYGLRRKAAMGSSDSPRETVARRRRRDSGASNARRT